MNITCSTRREKKKERRLQLLFPKLHSSYRRVNKYHFVRKKTPFAKICDFCGSNTGPPDYFGPKLILQSGALPTELKPLTNLRSEVCSANFISFKGFSFLLLFNLSS